MIVRARDGGDTFLVIEVSALANRTLLRVIDEPPFESSLRAIEEFDVVSRGLPSSWRAAIMRNDELTYMVIGPEPMTRPGFWDDFYRDPPGNNIALREYEEEVLVTARYSGLDMVEWKAGNLVLAE